MPNLVGIGNSQVPTNAMLGGLAYQDSVGEIDIEKIKARTSDTAVDIFVYDTRKDSDGGAWRHRTQNLSWYNEGASATRGARKEFPAVAVLVLQSLKLTIYDGDDPNLPMWMVVTGANNYAIETQATCTAALNAIVCIGCGGSGHDFYYVNFLRDSAYEMSTGAHNRFADNIGTRSSHDRDILVSSSVIISRKINDVAMTVLPNAPIDEITGLPVPTIALATDGGVSIIKNTNGTESNTVVDMTVNGESDVTKYIAFTKSNKLAFVHSGNWLYFYEIPASDLNTTYWNGLTGFIGRFTDTQRTWDNNGKGIPINVGANGLTDFLEDRAIGHTNGVDLIDINEGGLLGSGMHCGISTDFNTGWMQGNIKGAFLSDTDTTSVTGSELVTNGTFASNNVTGWTERESGGSFTASGGQATLAYSSGVASWRQDITITTGETYTLSFDIVSTTTSSIQFYYNHGSGDLGVSLTGSAGKFSATFVAASNSVRIFPRIFNSGNMVLDNISLRIAVEDHSPTDNRGFQVFGTITKEPVASGADLISYGGWSTSNYLLQPFHSDLNLSPGDYTIMAWIYPTGTGTGGIISRGSAGEYGPWAVSYSAQDATYVSSHDWDQSSSDGGTWGTVISSSGDRCKLNKWSQIIVTKSGSTAKLYINGILQGTDTSSFDPKVPTTNLIPTMIGVERRGGTGAINRPFPGRLALIRASNTATTEEQVFKMYNDEKCLFHENAKCTLYGTSNAVVALAHDDTNDVIHAGTSSGRSEFRGLNRINNTTTAVTTSISASNEFVAEQ